MIDELFKTILPKKLKGYEPRQGQLDMARAVDAALTAGSHLDVEAPCGVGKTFAYLAPLIKHCVEREVRGVVCTANIALQEQLVGKDLPFLAEVLPVKFEYALAKGIGNFLCLDRYYAAVDGAQKADVFGKGLGDIDRIAEWVTETATGDKNDLPFVPEPETWGRVCGVSDLCNGRKCRHFGPCFAMKARERARQATIIVCNYHLFFAHLAVRMATEEDVILPSYEFVVCDEAHDMADVARDFFGHRMTPRSIGFLRRGAKHLGGDLLMRRIEAASSSLFGGAATLLGKAKTRLKKPGVLDGTELEKSLDEYASRARQAMAGAQDEDVRDVLDKCATAAVRLRETARAFRTLDAENMVYWVEQEDRQPVLRSQLIDVSDVLHAELFDATASVISTSATLTAGGSFEFLRRQRGEAESREAVVGSPFNFERQCLLCVPDLGVDDPNDPQFLPRIAGAIAKLIEGLKGRTMCLFTSYRALDACANAAEETSIKTLRQGDKPRTKLLDEFRKGKGVALFATASFWQGVDIPGDPLSCLVIDRIPFTPPDEPLMEALSERSDDSFSNVMLPRAIIDLRQGFGRLIRSTTDRGAVVIFDRRLFTKPYGRLILQSLPACRTTQDLDDVFGFVPPPRAARKKKGKRIV